VSVFRLAAELIRRAAVDDGYEQDLHDALLQQDEAALMLRDAAIDEAALRYLTPSDWLWFAEWRQGHDGTLDLGLVAYLAAATGSREQRYRLRALVMRDRDVAEEAPEARLDEPRAAGLRWLREHARQFPEPIEVVYDALQVATEPAWFVLRVMTAPDVDRDEALRRWLVAFGEAREVPAAIQRRWFAFPDDPLAGERPR
jgi:hypothetical protein